MKYSVVNYLALKVYHLFTLRQAQFIELIFIILNMFSIVKRLVMLFYTYNICKEDSI